MEDITDADYRHTKRVCKDSETKKKQVNIMIWWTSKTRAMSYELRVQIYESKYELRVQIYELEDWKHELQD